MNSRKRKRTGPCDPVLLSSASPDAVLFVGKSSQTVWWKPARKDARTPEKPNLGLLQFNICAKPHRFKIIVLFQHVVYFTAGIGTIP
jgi:hypothetical protein